MDKVRKDMEEEVYNKLEEDDGKRIIYKLAHERDENSEDMKAGWGWGGDQVWYREASDREGGSIEGT